MCATHCLFYEAMFSLFIRDGHNVERRGETKNSFILVIPCCGNVLVSSKEAICDAKYRLNGVGDVVKILNLPLNSQVR